MSPHETNTTNAEIFSLEYMVTRIMDMQEKHAESINQHKIQINNNSDKINKIEENLSNANLFKWSFVSVLTSSILTTIISYFLTH